MLTKVDLVYVMELINLHLLIDAARIASASFICDMTCEGMDKVRIVMWHAHAIMMMHCKAKQCNQLLA